MAFSAQHPGINHPGGKSIRWFFSAAPLLLLLCVQTILHAQHEMATLPFEGEYRSYSKTSIVRTKTDKVKAAKPYVSLQALLDSLPEDTTMRSAYKSQGGMPDDRRVVQELKNISVTAWIHAVKFEGGENGDNDLHVVIGSSADLGDKHFMNVEVSSLPSQDDIDFTQLRDVRRAFLDLFPGKTFTADFKKIDPPLKVAIKGSLFFDAQHGAGCKACPGPGWAKPQTVWELHPVYAIKKAG